VEGQVQGDGGRASRLGVIRLQKCYKTSNFGTYIRSSYI
jgi:hypothetical protein